MTEPAWATNNEWLAPTREDGKKTVVCVTGSSGYLGTHLIKQVPYPQSKQNEMRF